MIMKGGPGSGKSVLARRISAKVAELGSYMVYHIPLHLFMLNASAQDGIRDFIKNDQFLYHEDPFDRDQDEGKRKILFVFDGLDELAKAGAVSLELARRFIGDLQQLIAVQNNHQTRIKVLVTGRDLVIQQNENIFDVKGQVIRLAPFQTTELSIQIGWIKEGKNLFEKDQRREWWEKYWRVKGKPKEELPESLLENPGDELLSISAEPLLNYLLARALDKDSEVLSGNRNINKVYHSLVIGVYNRRYSGGKKHLSLKEKDFQRILEEIAVAAWHGGDVRAVTYALIQERCVANGLETMLKEFGGMQEDGFMKLLVSFFFHQKGFENKGEKTFEFTHKSFGEYLTALRIVREMETVHKEYQRSKSSYSNRFGPEEALNWWIDVCGPTEIGENIFAFLKREIALRNEIHDFDAWQNTFVELMNYLLKQGWTMPVGINNRLIEANRIARNAEETLLLSLSSLSIITHKVSQLTWVSKYHAAQWLSFLCGQPGGGGELSFKGIHWIDFSGQIFTHKFFHEGNLSGVNFNGANLDGTNLLNAVLTKASLVKVSLVEANLKGANIVEVNLTDATLTGVNLDGANLIGSKLKGANLLKSNLSGANLAGADLVKANLGKANLERTNFEHACLQGANLREASLQGANLKGAILEGADLTRANLERANLQLAELEGADLGDTILYRTTFIEADLKGTNLKRANLKGADLKGANLTGAKLNEAHLNGASLKGTILKGAILKGANLLGVLLDDKTCFSRSILGTFSILNAYVRSKRLEGQELQAFLESIAVDDDE
jgi:uncharacterized protein YjbI with pentapeptide repeats